jgi:hypothetical protein
MEQPILRTKEFGDLPILNCMWKTDWGLYRVIVNIYIYIIMIIQTTIQFTNAMIKVVFLHIIKIIY